MIFDAAEHARQFFDALVHRELGDRGARGLAVGELRDAQVMMSLAATCGRCVTQSTWPANPSALQFAADDFGDRAADARIDFVEHHAARVLRGAGHLHGERQARQFATGGDLGERPQRLARIRGDAKFDLVDAVRGRLAVGLR